MESRYRKGVLPRVLHLEGSTTGTWTGRAFSKAGGCNHYAPFCVDCELEMPGNQMIRRWWQCLWEEGNQKSSWRSSWGQGRFLALSFEAGRVTGANCCRTSARMCGASLGSDTLVPTGACTASDSSTYGSFEVISIVTTSTSLAQTLIHKPHPPVSRNHQLFIRGPSPATQVNFTQAMGRNFTGFCLVPLKLWTFTESLLNARYS